MQGNHSKQSNPLSITWNVISVISGILGLVSLAENFIVWKGIFEQLIYAYRTVVHFPFHFFHIHWNEYLIDYLFIGSMCGVSFARALTYAIEKEYVVNAQYPRSAKVFYFVLYLFFWPLGILIALKQILFRDDDHNERQIKIRFVQWLLTILLGFMVFLVINTVLNDKL